MQADGDRLVRKTRTVCYNIRTGMGFAGWWGGGGGGVRGYNRPAVFSAARCYLSPSASSLCLLSVFKLCKLSFV